MSTIIDLPALAASIVVEKPFPYLTLSNFVKPDYFSKVQADYPVVNKGGSFPPSTLSYGSGFAQLLAEIQSSEMTAIIAEKFNIDLTGRATMVTVRGICRKTDGKIHRDNPNKLVTVLIYMNDDWKVSDGGLRLLRSPDDLNDVFAEVYPLQGTLLAFRNQPNAWHGHPSFDGPRRVIQLNWVNSPFIVWREKTRHSLVAFFKKLGISLNKNDY